MSTDIAIHIAYSRTAKYVYKTYTQTIWESFVC